VGDILKVIVARIDIFKQQVDFAIVQEPPKSRRPRR
jgi:hypothetical protein